MNKRIEKIKEIVQEKLSSSAHDLEHTFRVFKLARMLAVDEADVNMEVVELASLLHDIARVAEDSDKTGATDHAKLGAVWAERILKELDYPDEIIKNVKHCIETHRYRGDDIPKTKEAKILFDADKLDAIGAVGVARAYMIAGERGEKIYFNADISTYIKDNLINGKMNGRIKDISKHAPNIEFETKFRHIPERLFTEKAKRIAKERIAFMKVFFDRLKKEIAGEF